MRRSLAAVLLTVSGVCGCAEVFANEVLFKNSFEPTWIDGYYVGYQYSGIDNTAAMPVSEIPFGDLTHLMIGRVIPNADGSVDDTTFDIDAVNGPAFAHAAVNAAHAAGRKAILMIGGAGEIDGWRGAASDANWSNFATTLSNTANTYGADGLDIDWEPITDNNASNAQITSDHTELARLVTALRARRPDLLLTMPVGGYNPNDAPNVSEQSLFTTVTPQLDQINLMSYDMIFAGFGWDSWFTSPLVSDDAGAPLSVSSSIDYYKGLGIPAAKLGVGTGFFGACYRHVTGPRQLTNGGDIFSDADSHMSYKYIASTYVPNMTRTYDAVAKAPWLANGGAAVGPDSCTYVTYEDAASIADKAAWVRTNGLGGTIIWTIGEGHLSSGNDPLLEATRIAFP
jgi:chitinase